MPDLPPIEVYVSTDIEADGPIPGPHSMLSLGSAAFLPPKQLLATYSANLDLLPGSAPHPTTAKFWETHAKAYRKTRKDTRPPEIVMPEYAAWVESLAKIAHPEDPSRVRPVFVGYPAAFDFSFVHWYLIRFAQRNPFSHSALDMKTMAMTMLRVPFTTSVKGTFPKAWFDKLPHTHVAVEDAKEQGAMFCNMLADLHAGVQRQPR